MTLSIGTRLGPYEVLAPLGAGGMGEVWRARDTRLDRQVAIKVLPEDFLWDSERRDRFEREAKLLAAVNHPNIAAIHSFEEISGRYLLVQELLEGESLRDKLGFPLPPKKAVEYAILIAQGLSAAHEKGIVHRDLKPENVFVTKDGRIKILDFGIAKLTQPQPFLSAKTEARTEPKTEPGVVLGTAGYMSPEQLLGKQVDQRSDLFSLGVILYEMLVGKRPFQRETAPETMAAILKEDPPGIFGTSAGVPLGLDRIVWHCLEKEPANRFQSARDVAFALGSLGAEATSESRLSAAAVSGRKRYVWTVLGLAVALAAGWVFYSSRHRLLPPKSADLSPRRVLVVPFENRTGDKSFDPVGAMAADWVIQGLTQTGELQVIPLATVLSYSRDATWKPAAGEGADRLAALSAETGAGTVVSGACYLSGGSLHVRADVFDMREKKLLGAVEPAEASVEEPLQAVHALRQRLMVMLAMHLNPRTAPVASSIGQPPSYEAYKTYIAGLERFMVRDYRAAIPLLMQSADPGHAFFQPLLLATFGRMNLDEYAEADAGARRLSRERERLSPLDRARLDQIEAFFRGDMMAQLDAARKAAELAPMGGATFEHGRVALRAGRPREAVDALRRLRPDSPFVREWIPYWWVLSWSQHLLGDSAGMLESASRSRELHPGSLQIVQVQGIALIALGRLDELERLYDALLALPNELRASPSSAILALRASPSSVMLAWGDELRWHGHSERSGSFVTRALDWLAARPETESHSEAHRALLGQALLSAGRGTEAEAVLSRLAAERPEKVTYLGLLGVLAARRGDHKRATEISKWLRETNQPYLFGSQTHYAGSIAAWLGEKERAVSLLREALGQGLTPLELHADGLLYPIWDYPPFQELLKPKN